MMAFFFVFNYVLILGCCTDQAYHTSIRSDVILIPATFFAVQKLFEYYEAPSLFQGKYKAI